MTALSNAHEELVAGYMEWERASDACSIGRRHEGPLMAMYSLSLATLPSRIPHFRHWGPLPKLDHHGRP